MNRSLLLFAVVLVVLIASTFSQSFYKSGNCPMRNTVTNCVSRCIGDGQCPSNQKCCPNKCGSTSCADTSPVNTGSDGGYKGSSNITVTSVRFVERNEWGAQPPSEPLKKMKLPVPYVIISQTSTDFCTIQSVCIFYVKFAQTFHIESRKWSDIAYNFLVGGDGLAYVGRSWDYIGAHSFGFNDKSIGISFIGTFNAVVPPKTQLDAAQKIIELGVEAGKIAPDYKLLGHRQISKTLNSGEALYNEIKKWPHWAPLASLEDRVWPNRPQNDVFVVCGTERISASLLFLSFISLSISFFFSFNLFVL